MRRLAGVVVGMAAIVLPFVASIEPAAAQNVRQVTSDPYVVKWTPYNVDVAIDDEWWWRQADGQGVVVNGLQSIPASCNGTANDYYTNPALTKNDVWITNSAGTTVWERDGNSDGQLACSWSSTGWDVAVNTDCAVLHAKFYAHTFADPQTIVPQVNIKVCD